METINYPSHHYVVDKILLVSKKDTNRINSKLDHSWTGWNLLGEPTCTNVWYRGGKCPFLHQQQGSSANLNLALHTKDGKKAPVTLIQQYFAPISNPATDIQWECRQIHCPNSASVDCFQTRGCASLHLKE